MSHRPGDPGHGGQAAKNRGAKNSAHQLAVRAWSGEQPDPAVFTAEILPALRELPISQLVAATGLFEHYCSLSRLEKRVPHPRHWDELRAILASRGLTHAARQANIPGPDTDPPCGYCE